MFFSFLLLVVCLFSVGLIIVFRFGRLEKRSIGLRRQENASIVIQTATLPLLQLLRPSPYGGSGSGGGGGGGGDDGAQMKSGMASLERALSSLVELSDIPGVFEVAVSTMLAGGFMVTLSGVLVSGGGGDTPFAREARVGFLLSVAGARGGRGDF